MSETKTNDQSTCTICGEPMPPGEEMFKFHGYSGPCPKPPLPREQPDGVNDPRTGRPPVDPARGLGGSQG